MSARPSYVPQHTLPSDPEQSRFRFIIVAGKRARQIHRGAHPIIPTASKKPTRIAMVESERGLIAFESGLIAFENGE